MTTVKRNNIFGGPNERSLSSKHWPPSCVAGQPWHQSALRSWDRQLLWVCPGSLGSKHVKTCQNHKKWVYSSGWSGLLGWRLPGLEKGGESSCPTALPSATRSFETQNICHQLRRWRLSDVYTQWRSQAYCSLSIASSKISVESWLIHIC